MSKDPGVVCMQIAQATTKEPWPDLTETKNALGRYMLTEPERLAQLDAAETEEEITAWTDAEKAAEDAVREAFYRDTKDRNTRDNCMLTNIGWLSELVKRWVEETRMSE